MLNALTDKGVKILQPESVAIGDDIDPERIDSSAVIHPGTRIHGKETLICRGAVIGKEAPATLENCFVGPEASLGGGYYRNCVFLRGAGTGSAAHVRDGTIFEEYATSAHSTGVKQTILFPFVTLGSLINFCDCLMAGGTGRKNHSEVGSSYIHFNFTPQQDKATPSMAGDVPQGVMLNQAPIFLGGQGGLVGPTRLAYGTVTAAGTICRKDELRPGRLLFGGAAKSGNISYDQGTYGNIRRVVVNNLNYIANLFALRAWYQSVRTEFISENLPGELVEGLHKTLSRGIDERIAQLMKFAEKMSGYAEAFVSPGGRKDPGSRLYLQKTQLYERREELVALIRDSVDNFTKDHPGKSRLYRALDEIVARSGKSDYINAIQSLEPEDAEAGTAWLQSVVDACMADWITVIPVFNQ